MQFVIAFCERSNPKKFKIRLFTNGYLFAGFLPLDVVCYIWDQYILSMKLPSFNCIATFSTAMLMLMREDILTCQNVRLKFVLENFHDQRMITVKSSFYSQSFCMHSVPAMLDNLKSVIPVSSFV